MFNQLFSRRSKRKLRQALAVIPAFGLAFTAGCAAIAAPSNDDVEKKVDSLVSQMTLDEKIKILSGTPKDEMHVPGIERLGIPELKFSDGPVGVRVWGKSTAYPVGAMLASTWDTNAAYEYGKALGRDSRARGVHILLGPGVDLYRVAQNGRNFEYFGEDPYLSSLITVAWVKGCQDQRVATSVKHYAANDQEILRDSVNTIVDERRLHEICFPPFKAAVIDANAWTLMAAYNKINGDWCTANKYLLDDVLRKQWGFKGVLMSDWGAVHDCLGPITAGTDLEMGKAAYYTPEKIKGYLNDKKLTQSVIDEHVRRILRMTVAMGWLDHKQEDKSIPLNDPTSAATALKVAREGLVLLKNENSLLPLDRNKIKSVVVIGPNACPAVIGGGGSSGTDPFVSTSLRDAITATAGNNVNVSYIPSWIGPNPTTANAFNMGTVFEPQENGQRGARGEYFESTDLTGTPKVAKTDTNINFWWGDWHPVDEITAKHYSVRWKAKIKPTQTDRYTFSCSSNGARVTLDGKPLFDNWNDGGKLGNSSQSIVLQGGESHDILVEYHNVGGVAMMQFTYGRSNEEFTPEQAKQIASADAVIASVGFNPFTESEGSDRPYDLPADQVSMLKRVSQLNPHTVVVLNSGGNVGMDKWIDQVAGIMHAWYPGQNGNTAVAEAVFGDLNPSGKLPDTFEKRFEDSPAYGNYPGDASKGGTVKYAEGIYVGYRGFDKKNITPRYPFGYGLSYTTFSMQNMKVNKEPQIQAAVDVTNTGAREGAEIVQLYVRPIATTADRPVQELKGFARVALKPGQTATVTFPLGPDSFATYDEKKHGWTSPAGQYELAVGSSSRDIHCSQSVSWSNNSATALKSTQPPVVIER